MTKTTENHWVKDLETLGISPKENQIFTANSHKFNINQAPASRPQALTAVLQLMRSAKKIAWQSLKNTPIQATKQILKHAHAYHCHLYIDQKTDTNPKLPYQTTASLSAVKNAALIIDTQPQNTQPLAQWIRKNAKQLQPQPLPSIIAKLKASPSSFPSPTLIIIPPDTSHSLQKKLHLLALQQLPPHIAIITLPQPHSLNALGAKQVILWQTGLTAPHNAIGFQPTSSQNHHPFNLSPQQHASYDLEIHFTHLSQPQPHPKSPHTKRICFGLRHDPHADIQIYQDAIQLNTRAHVLSPDGQALRLYNIADKKTHQDPVTQFLADLTQG